MGRYLHALDSQILMNKNLKLSRSTWFDSPDRVGDYGNQDDRSYNVGHFRMRGMGLNLRKGFDGQPHWRTGKVMRGNSPCRCGRFGDSNVYPASVIASLFIRIS